MKLNYSKCLMLHQIVAKIKEEFAKNMNIKTN